MLPANLVSIYQQYKEDTNAVASWLASTAKACGYPADLLSGDTSQARCPERSKRLKGKARKEAKAAASKSSGSSSNASRPDYIIAIKDFIPLAEFVAASKKPVVSVPSAFTITLNRVIATRSGFSGQMADLGDSPSASADSSHSYFVGVLQKVREILKPRTTPASQKAASPPTPLDPINQLGGRFARLHVYEPSEEFVAAPDIERPAQVSKDTATYIAEPLQDLREVLFAYGLLVNDLATIRGRIQWIWATYRRGDFDLVACAIATNTACDLARNMMEDSEPMFKAYGGAVEIGKIFYVSHCMHEGFSLDNIVGPDKMFNPDTYEIADRTYMIAYTMLQNILEIVKLPGPLPVFFHDPSGTYDPTPDWDSMTRHEKYKQDEYVMIDFLNDLMALVRHVPDYPVHDEFIRGMLELDRTKEIPMYLAFAAQMFLDIHHILRGRVYSAYETLMSELRSMDEDLELHLNFHAKLEANRGNTFKKAAATHLRSLIEWVQHDPVQIHAQALSESGEPLPMLSQRLLRYSPVISGLLLYHVRTLKYNMSLALVNSCQSLLYPMHLYNALQQEKRLLPYQFPEECWADMTMAQTLLGKDSFYVGSELPKNPADYVKMLGLQTGISASAFAKTRDFRRLKAGGLISEGGARKIKTDCAAVSNMFIDRYVYNTGQVDWTPEHVDRVISRSRFEMSESEREGAVIMEEIRDPGKLRERKRTIAADLAGKRAAGAQTDPGKLIETLFFALEAEAPKMMFPYLTLHRAALGILDKVWDACDPLVMKPWASVKMDGLGQVPHVVIPILMSLSMEDDRLFTQAAEAVKNQLRLGEGNKARQRLEAMGIELPVLQQDPDTGTSST